MNSLQPKHLILFIVSILCIHAANFANSSNKISKYYTTHTLFTKKVYTLKTNGLHSTYTKIKLVSSKGNFTKYIPTHFFYNNTMQQLQLPTGKYYVWIYVGNHKTGCWINNGYWII